MKYFSKECNALLPLMILFVICPFVFPTGLQYSSLFYVFFYKILYYWRIVSCVSCVVLCIYKNIKTNISMVSIAFLLFDCALLVCTIIKRGSFSSFLSTWGGFFCFFVGCDFFVEKNAIVFTKTMKIWFFVISIINLVTMIIYRNGMPLDSIVVVGPDSKYVWLWGYKNSMSVLVILYSLFSFVDSYLHNQKMYCFSNLLCMAICFLTAIFSQSSTLAVLVLIIPVGLLLSNLSFFKPLYDVRLASLLGVLISILIVFFGFQKYFSWLIVDLLGKDLTLTTRTELWQYSLSDISQSLLFGYGVQSSSSFGLLRYSPSYSHCHNAILTLLYQGGLVSFALFVVFYCLSIKSCSNKNRELFNPYISVIVFVQLLFYITGSITGCSFFAILLFCNHSRLLERLTQKMEVHYRRNPMSC